MLTSSLLTLFGSQSFAVACLLRFTFPLLAHSHHFGFSSSCNHLFLSDFMTVKASTNHHDLLYFCMVMRINIDCTGCYRKVKRALLDMPELDSHLLEKKQTRVVVCGRFIPQDVAIKIKKKANRRVEILDIQDMSESNGEMEDQKPMTNNWTHLTSQNQMETCLALEKLNKQYCLTSNPHSRVSV